MNFAQCCKNRPYTEISSFQTVQILFAHVTNRLKKTSTFISNVYKCFSEFVSHICCVVPQWLWCPFSAGGLSLPSASIYGWLCR